MPDAPDATYRLLFTLSLALLLHVVVLGFVRLPASDAQEPLPLRFLLAGSMPAIPANEAPPPVPEHHEPPSDSAQVNNEVTAVPEAPAPPETTPTPTPTPPPTPTPVTVDTQTATAPAAASRVDPASSTQETQASTASPAGQTAVTQLTSQPELNDPYLAALWQQVAIQLRQQRISELQGLQQPETVRLELHLMSNGALIRVNTLSRSAVEGLNQAALRAALAASPYPPPPGDDGQRGYRYPVELRFLPAGAGNP
ncbi:MAG: TonB family protein [Marinobacter sp.]|nr:TonB family protein [Marinobacter sp.]